MALLGDVFKGFRAGAQEFMKVAEIPQKTAAGQQATAQGLRAIGSSADRFFNAVAKAIDPAKEAQSTK